MSHPALPTLTLTDGPTVTRMGYGAMQLAGPHSVGEPHDHDEALAVLEEVVASGITFIDTADFYGPEIVNRLIREALYPYDGITIATKVGVTRRDDGSVSASIAPDDLRREVEDNLEHLGVDTLDLVYLRTGVPIATNDESIAEGFGALAELQRQGVIRQLGLSGVSSAQLSEAQEIAPVVSISNLYNLAYRVFDDLAERCAQEGIAFAGWGPFGIPAETPFTSDSSVLASVATRLDVSPQQVALAWILKRTPTTVVIPGTSTRTHLRDNISAVELVLPDDAIAELDRVAAEAPVPRLAQYMAPPRVPAA